MMTAGRQHLFTPAETALLALALFALLIALVPSQESVQPFGRLPDELSLTYLRLLRRYEPTDAPMRLQLAGQLLSQGHPAQAKALLGPLLPEAQVRKTVHR